MFQPIQPNDFLDIYNSLPADLKDALVSDWSAEKIRKIATGNYLESEKNSRLADMVAYTLMGKLSPKDFIKILREELSIDPKSASDIAQDINREIFFPVRESLKELYGLTAVETELSSVTPPANQAGETSEGKTAAPPREPTKQSTMTSQTPKPPPAPIGENMALPPSDLPVSSSEIESQQAEIKPSEKPEVMQPSDDKSSFNKVSADKYKETIEPEDTQNFPLQTPKPQPGPKIEGNVIDLKGIDVE